jgi:hypothetical protein
MNNYYILQETYGDYSYAGSKARSDIFYFISHHRFKIKEICRYRRIKLFSIKGIRNIAYKIGKFCTLVSLFITLKQKSILFLQYPFYTFCSTLSIANMYLRFLKKTKEILFITVLHDINGIRFITEQKELLNHELTLFEKFDYIIAHNETMKNFLILNGLQKSKISTLNLFDYKSEFIFSRRKKNNTVAFAGNLDKSNFIKKLPELSSNVKYNLYGLLREKFFFKENEYITYYGVFPPDVIPETMLGGYGLVWDGDDLETCAGDTGVYLRLNTSHKISLYILSGLPIIIWSGAAMSKFIIENNLGFAVNSLFDIEKNINSITEEQYLKMQNSLVGFAELIRTGKNIIRTVDKILSEIAQ